MGYKQIWDDVGNRPTSGQREALREQDTQSDNELVLTTSTGAANSGYAYHEIGDDGKPVCGKTHPKLEPVSREEAKRRNKSPCGTCARLSDS